MDATVAVLIKEVLRDLNVIAFNETPKAPQQMIVLSKFNMLIDSWRNDNLLVSKLTRQVFDLVSGTASYTIGASATFNTQRPEEIYRAGLVDVVANSTDPTEIELNILTDEGWASKTLKTQVGYPDSIWYETSMANGRVYVHPIPDAAYDIALYTPVPIPDVAETAAGLATSIALPPGYKRMIVNNLAIECADAFEKSVTATMIAKAMTSMEIVKRRNAKPSVLRLPAELTRRSMGFNINTNG